MTLFGRDTLITSFQAHAARRRPRARGRCDALAALQATERTTERDAEPGKILHEMRFGQVAAQDGPVPLLRLGRLDAAVPGPALGDVALERRRRARRASSSRRPVRALALDRRARRPRRRRLRRVPRAARQRGLEIQCWKDSWDSMRFARRHARAVAARGREVQGYAYAARMRCAELAREVWGDPALAERLEARGRRSCASASTRRSGSSATAPATTRSRSTTRSGQSTRSRSNVGPPAVDGHRRATSAAAPMRRAAVSRRCSRAGASAPVRRRPRLTTRSATTRAPSGRTTPACRRRAGALRLRAVRAGSPRSCWRPPSTSTSGCRRCSPATRESDAVPGRVPDRLLAAGLGGRRPGAVPHLHARIAPRSPDRPAACRRGAAGGLPAAGAARRGGAGPPIRHPRARRARRGARKRVGPASPVSGRVNRLQREAPISGRARSPDCGPYHQPPVVRPVLARHRVTSAAGGRVRLTPARRSSAASTSSGSGDTEIVSTDGSTASIVFSPSPVM